MSRWKLLAAVPFLMLPLAYAGISSGDGIEHHDSRAAVVLPSAVQGPQVVLRPKDDPSDPPGPSSGPSSGPSPGSSGPDRPRPALQELDCDHDDTDDDDDSDDSDDGVEVVQPCPDAVGDDEDDDDGGDDSGEGDGDDDAGDD